MLNQSVTWRRAALLAVAASVVVGPATIRAEEAEKPWDRSIALGLTVNTGNQDTILFTGALKGEKLWKHDELRLELSGAYGKNDGAVNTERLLGRGQYKRLFTERFFGAFLLEGFHDGITELAYRLTASPGVGYYFIKSEKTRFSGEVGGAYVQEKYNGQSENGFFTLRVADRFDRQLNDNAKIWQQTEWLPQVDDFNNYLLNTEVGVEAALTKAMSLRVVGQHRYDNEPAPGRKNYDLTLISSLVYKF
jgi:putative salt-induced outer membrane protein